MVDKAEAAFRAAEERGEAAWAALEASRSEGARAEGLLAAMGTAINMVNAVSNVDRDPYTAALSFFTSKKAALNFLLAVQRMRNSRNG